MQDLSFCDRPISLSVISRFVHVVTYDRISFSLKAEEYSTNILHFLYPLILRTRECDYLLEILFSVLLDTYQERNCWVIW